MELSAEAVRVFKRVRRSLVRAARTTRTRNVPIEEDLVRESVVVERVPIGRIVNEMPPVRQEGDTTILPVVEEELVVVRRLVLKEEVRLRRVRTTERNTDVVAVREQHVVVTRTDLDDDPAQQLAALGESHPEPRKDSP